jgi:hypothetical protein
MTRSSLPLHNHRPGIAFIRCEDVIEVSNANIRIFTLSIEAVVNSGAEE